MPGVRTASGGMTPTGTTSSASAITQVGRHRHDRIEVRRGQPVSQIEEMVGLMRMDQRDVGPQRQLEQVVSPVDRDHPLPSATTRADAGRRQHAAEPGAAGADALGQRALRHEFHLSSPSSILRCIDGVRPDVRDDHAGDAAGIDQLADAEAGPRGVVGDHRQVARAPGDQRIHQPLRRPDAEEAADHDAGAVRHQSALRPPP